MGRVPAPAPFYEDTSNSCHTGQELLADFATFVRLPPTKKWSCGHNRQPCGTRSVTSSIRRHEYVKSLSPNAIGQAGCNSPTSSRTRSVGVTGCSSSSERLPSRQCLVADLLLGSPTPRISDSFRPHNALDSFSVRGELVTLSTWASHFHPRPPLSCKAW